MLTPIASLNRLRCKSPLLLAIPESIAYRTFRFGFGFGLASQTSAHARLVIRTRGRILVRLGLSSVNLRAVTYLRTFRVRVGLGSGLGVGLGLGLGLGLVLVLGLVLGLELGLGVESGEDLSGPRAVAMRAGVHFGELIAQTPYDVDVV